MSDLERAWDELHDAKPEHWFVGRPVDMGRGRWQQYAFDTRERGRLGHRTHDWTAQGRSELEVVREMARCLREIRAGRVPQQGSGPVDRLWDDAAMWAARIWTVSVVLAVVASSAGACVPFRNRVADREVVCRDVPEGLCMRIAEVGLEALDIEGVEADVGRIPTLQVYPDSCPEPRGATRCWTLEATNDRGGVGVPIYGWPDGSISTLRRIASPSGRAPLRPLLP